MSKLTKRIKNWPEYNQSLIRRGSITFWCDEDFLDNWLCCEKSGKRGAPNTYSDIAITCILTLKNVYSLSLRAAQGLGESVIRLMGASTRIPNYSTLSRRQAGLSIDLAPRARDIRNIALDSTGIKVYGEGEWKVRMHGYSKRRRWLKLHLAVDTNTHDVVASIVTDHSMHDSEVVHDLLGQIETPLGQVAADGAYDTRTTYDAIHEREGYASIPPRSGAKIWQHGNSQKTPLQRDENLRAIRQHGRKKWKKESGYYRRSLSETAMYRVKQLFGNKVASRTFSNQCIELYLRCAAMNRMISIGMPEYYENP